MPRSNVKYDPRKLMLLVEARGKKLSQAGMGAYFGLTGPRRHDTVGSWERGQSKPHMKLRPRFLAYLLDRLRLAEEPQKFQRLWASIMVEEWEWEPLGKAELLPYFLAGIPAAIDYSPELTPLPPPPRSFQKPLPAEPLPSVDLFLGREAAVAEVTSLLTQSRLAMITGMPGAGKTSLAVKIAEQWRTAENSVFWYRVYPGHAIDGLVRELAGFLYWRGKRELWHIYERARQNNSQPPDPGNLLGQMFTLLADEPCLVWLDDFHNAETDRLVKEFWFYLKRTMRMGSVVFLITTRRKPSLEDAPDAFALSGLSLDASADLVNTQLAPPLAESLLRRLHHRTAGNPRLLLLAAQALTQHQDPADLIEKLETTDGVETYLLGEVDRTLTEKERAAMVAVALLESPCSREAVEAVLGGQAVHDTLSGLKEHYLLNTAGAADDRQYFLHSMLQGYFGRLLSYEAPKMHSRAGKYYRRQQEALRAAQHFLKAGQPKQAARLATEDAWASVNRGEAEALCELLKRLAPVEMDDLLRARVAVARGDVYNFLRSSSEAVSSYQFVLRTLPAEASVPETRELRARACLGMGDLRQHDSLVDARSWLERGLEELANADSSIRAELLIKIGTLSMALGKHQEALHAVQQSLGLLPETPNTLRMRALITQGAIYSSQGDVAQGHTYTRRALDIAEDLHDHFRLLSILNNSGLENGILGKWGDAEADFLRALGIAQQIGSQVEESKLANNLGVLYTDMGRLGEALTYVTRARELAENLELYDLLPFVLTSLGDLYIRREDWQAAEEALVEAEEAAQGPGADYPLAEAYFLRSHVLRATGRTREAVELAQSAVDLAHELDLMLEEGKAWRVLGQAHLAEGQTKPALEAFQRSLDLLADQNAYEAARTKEQMDLALAIALQPL